MPAPPQPSRPEGEPTLTTAERVATVIRDRIVTGALAPGTPLREAALGAELGVSRNTLREGLRLLVAQGLAAQQLYHGTVVETLTTQRVTDIYTARRAIELHAIDESGRAPDHAFDALDAAIAAAERAVARRRWGDVGTASLRFHQAVVGLLGSEVLDEFFAQIVAQLRLAFGAATDEERFQEPWIARDLELASLLAAGRRAEAREAMSRYLDASEQSVLDVVRLAERARSAPRRPRQPSAEVTTLRGDT